MLQAASARVSYPTTFKTQTLHGPSHSHGLRLVPGARIDSRWGGPISPPLGLTPTPFAAPSLGLSGGLVPPGCGGCSSWLLASGPSAPLLLLCAEVLARQVAAPVRLLMSSGTTLSCLGRHSQSLQAEYNKAEPGERL